MPALLFKLDKKTNKIIKKMPEIKFSREELKEVREKQPNANDFYWLDEDDGGKIFAVKEDDKKTNKKELFDIPDSNSPNKMRILDPVKISLVGLDLFLPNAKSSLSSLTDRLKLLELLSKDIATPEYERKNMKNILENLNKILTCASCHKEIDWDKNEGVYIVQPEISGKHKTCFKEGENI